MHVYVPYDNQMGCPSHLSRWRLHAHPDQCGGVIPRMPKRVEVPSGILIPFHEYGGVPSPFNKGLHNV